MMMFSTLEGAGKRGRPFKSWNDYVRKDLDSLGLALIWWKRCQDRPSWKAVRNAAATRPKPTVAWKGV